MNFAKTSQYHDATSDRRFLIFFSAFSIQSTKAAQYNDATNNTRYLFFSWNVPEISQKRLGTKLLQITRVILFFCGICNEKHQNGSVPWCYKWQISSTNFMIVPMKFIKTAQYHDATNNMRHLIFLQVFPMTITKKAQYHDATDTRFSLHFSRYFTWNSLKRFSTTMLQMTCSISILFHGIFHAIHQNSSVPWCYK